MKGLKTLKRMLAMGLLCLCLTFATVPAMEVHAATQTEQAAEGGATESQSASSDEEAFLMIMMGGVLLIILFAVISSMATVSSSIAVAVNMDVDGE